MHGDREERSEALPTTIRQAYGSARTPSRRASAAPMSTVLLAGTGGAQDDLLDYIFRLEGFLTLRAQDEREVARLASQFEPQVMVLDETVSPPTAATAPASGRESGRPAVPVVRLVEDPCRVEPGCRYLVGKPIEPAALVACIRAAIADSSSEPSDQVLAVGDIRMDLSTHRVFRGDREVALAPVQFRLLRHLLSFPEQVFDRDYLFHVVSLRQATVGPRTVDVHVMRLRRALCALQEPDVIRTVRSVGYALCVGRCAGGREEPER